jgi:hypothetical protein
MVRMSIFWACFDDKDAFFKHPLVRRLFKFKCLRAYPNFPQGLRLVVSGRQNLSHQEDHEERRHTEGEKCEAEGPRERLGIYARP